MNKNNPEELTDFDPSAFLPDNGEDAVLDDLLHQDDFPDEPPADMGNFGGGSPEGGRDEDFGDIEPDVGHGAAGTYETGDFGGIDFGEDAEPDEGEEAYNPEHDEYHVQELDSQAANQEEAEVAPTESGNSTLIKKYAFPAACTAVAVIVGGVALNFLSPVLFGSSGGSQQSAPVQFAAPNTGSPAPVLPGAPTLNAPTAAPSLPPATAPALPAPSLPSLPSAQPVANPNVSANAPAFEQAENVAPGLSSFQPAVPAPATYDNALTAQNAALVSSITSLVGQLQTLTSKLSTLDGEMKAANVQMAAQLNAAISRLNAVEQRMAKFEVPLGGINDRLAALEAVKVAAVAPVVPVAEVKAPEAKTVPEVKPEGIPVPSVKPEVVTKATPAAPKVISGYSLRGVSGTAALVQTPGGLVRVYLGRKLVGVGVAEQILRSEDGTWMLQTSAGLIKS
ncbi:hypothetical protein ACFOY8_13255 [Thalassospira xianhensis]|uniref:Uncharacterized protein n=1 Tax=Thalassospira xianhensis MCCC 1A02616 TaxID=1177929 RepID=A0A367UII1_9PROT|nr:hypothetical protein [Thalassospira xianhensis]RCK07831.1 hypothetical protein TH5_02035 [Thalassospira xianhensis MCCC 1A02616]